MCSCVMPVWRLGSAGGGAMDSDFENDILRNASNRGDSSRRRAVNGMSDDNADIVNADFAEQNLSLDEALCMLHDSFTHFLNLVTFEHMHDKGGSSAPFYVPTEWTQSLSDFNSYRIYSASCDITDRLNSLIDTLRQNSAESQERYARSLADSLYSKQDAMRIRKIHATAMLLSGRISAIEFVEEKPIEFSNLATGIYICNDALLALMDYAISGAEYSELKSLTIENNLSGSEEFAKELFVHSLRNSLALSRLEQNLNWMHAFNKGLEKSWHNEKHVVYFSDTNRAVADLTW